MEKSTSRVKPQEKGDETLAMIVIGLGFSVVWYYILYIFFNGSGVTPDHAFTNTYMVLRALALALGVVTVLMVARKADWFSTGRGRLVLQALTIVGALLMTLMHMTFHWSEVNLPSALHFGIGCLFHALFGAGIEALYLLWGELIADFDHIFSLKTFVIAATVGALLFFVSCNSEPIVRAFLLTVLCLASLVLYKVMTAQAVHAEALSATESAEFLLLSPRDNLGLFAYSIIFGYIVSPFARLTIAELPTNSLITIAFICGALITLVTLPLNLHRSRLGIVQRYLLPFVLLSLVLPSIANEQGVLALRFLSTVCFALFLVATSSDQPAIANWHHTNAFWTIAQTNQGKAGGFLVGSMLNVLVQLPQLSAYYNAVSIGLMFALLVFVVVVSFGRNMFGEASRIESDWSYAPIVDKPPALTEDERRELVCERFELSRREREIFDVWSRGRSAEHIRETLSISPHTVKTHISNIYKKLGVKSRGEMLDLIEKAQR